MVEFNIDDSKRTNSIDSTVRRLKRMGMEDVEVNVVIGGTTVVIEWRIPGPGEKDDLENLMTMRQLRSIIKINEAGNHTRWEFRFPTIAYPEIKSDEKTRYANNKQRVEERYKRAMESAGVPDGASMYLRGGGTVSYQSFTPHLTMSVPSGMSVGDTLDFLKRAVVAYKDEFSSDMVR